MPLRRRLLIVGRTRFAWPLDETVRAKFDAVAVQLDLRVVARGRGGDGTFRLLAPGAGFWAQLPLALAREVRAFRPDAILAQDPHVAAVARAAAPRTPVIVEVHGDWRTATRLYGSGARRLLSPLADGVASLALRRATAIRTVSPYTTSLVRAQGLEPASTFPAFMDLEPFLRPVVPLPQEPRALFVGVLEHYKGVDELAAAWRLVAPRVSHAHLHVVGRGTRAQTLAALVRDLPDRVTWSERLAAIEVADALDAATCLVLPSRSEGMGRVLVEALLRGRPVVAARVGGIVDLIRDGENGVLVPACDPHALADALASLLADPDRATSLASAARPSVEPWLATPEQYAERIRELVETALHLET